MRNTALEPIIVQSKDLSFEVQEKIERAYYDLLVENEEDATEEELLVMARDITEKSRFMLILEKGEIR